MGLIIQLICIGFDLCIESTQVLAGSIVGINIIRRTGWLIIVVQRLARYQLVGSRSIRSSSGCACSKRFCTKSLAPVVFAVLLSRCRSVCILDRLFISIKLHVTLFICLVDLDVVAEI